MNTVTKLLSFGACMSVIVLPTVDAPPAVPIHGPSDSGKCSRINDSLLCQLMPWCQSVIIIITVSFLLPFFFLTARLLVIWSLTKGLYKCSLMLPLAKKCSETEVKWRWTDAVQYRTSTHTDTISVAAGLLSNEITASWLVSGLPSLYQSVFSSLSSTMSLCVGLCLVVCHCL